VLKPHELWIKSAKAAFVGYKDSTRQYKVCDPVLSKVVRSHNVEFFELERLDFDGKGLIDGHLITSQNAD
jgi:hypothetical protein